MVYVCVWRGLGGFWLEGSVWDVEARRESQVEEGL